MGRIESSYIEWLKSQPTPECRGKSAYELFMEFCRKRMVGWSLWGYVREPIAQKLPQEDNEYKYRYIDTTFVLVGTNIKYIAIFKQRKRKHPFIKPYAIIAGGGKHG